MNKLFGRTPMSLYYWLEVLAVSIAAYILIEIEKWLRRRREKVEVPSSNAMNRVIDSP